MGSKIIENKYLILGTTYGNDEIGLRKAAAGDQKVLKIFISDGGDEVSVLGSSIPNVPDTVLSASPEDWQYEYITDSIRRISESIDLRLEITTDKNESDFDIVINPIPEQDYLSSYYNNGITGLISISHQTGFNGYEYQGKIVENLIHTDTTKKTQKVYFLHELGHLLGLEHPMDFNDNDGIDEYYTSDFTYQKDDFFPYEFTVMGWNGNHDEQFSLTELWFTKADIRALREIWGSHSDVLKNMIKANKYFLPGIKDYDGNLHATSSASVAVKTSYKYQGKLDVNKDGTEEVIFTNKVSGRWVTASIDSITGEIDYSDYGAGGTTRVVGIYIDPLVASGDVVQGSDHDSQRRFQNDLKNDNLLVKASGDYDSDGTQEVYWKIVDGTAYLRSLMHADGNIKYANYQSLDQMTNYLTGHGFADTVALIA